MSIEELQNISDDYEDIYLGLSDKNINKIILDTIISILTEQATKITSLETDVANRMLCTKYKVD